MSFSSALTQLGWRPVYSQQLTLDELEQYLPARVTGVHRNSVDVYTESGISRAALPGAILAGQIAVGDWCVVDPATLRIVRLLDRQSHLARLAAGESQRQQSIAANVDTLFIVTSCNDDFNVSRLERYLALAHEAGIEPVIVLTKIDLCADIDIYLDQLRDSAPNAIVVTVNAVASDCKRTLKPWLLVGQTIAFVGSSGVGKSTLVNSLLGSNVQPTHSIREDDAKGRHTTTSRQMLLLPSGAWVIDTPGMRELKVGAAEHGVRAAFDDIETLAQSCRFRDCTHETESGCAITIAISTGQLDERRFRNYQKLRREAANTARTVHERHERDRQFGKLYKSVMKQRRKDRGSE